MKIKIFFIALVMLCTAADAQNPLKVGDQLPDLTYTYSLKGQTHKAKLSSLKGKLTIIDFWATWCSSCIETFYKMEQYTADFKGELNVILVNSVATTDTRQKIDFALARRQRTVGHSLNLPSVTGDKVFEAYFPWRILPHYVWLNSDRRVVAITGYEELTDKNIAEFLRKETLAVKTKADDRKYDVKMPLYVSGNGIGASGNVPIMYRSTIAAGDDALGYHYGQNILPTGQKHVYRINVPLFFLYQQDFRINMNVGPGQWIFDLKNPADKKYFSRKYKLSYEHIGRAGTDFREDSKQIREAVSKAFPFELKNEKRKINAIVLKGGSDLNKWKTKGGETLISLDSAYSKKFAKNYRLENFATAFLNSFFPVPVVDETGLSADMALDIVLPDDIYKMDILALKKWLTDFGFVFAEEQRELEVVVVSDRRND